MMAKKKIYPIGIQTFEKLRTGGYLYADKTEYVYNLTRVKIGINFDTSSHTLSDWEIKEV